MEQNTPQLPNEEPHSEDNTSLYITNMMKSLKSDLFNIAKEEDTKVAPMVKKILRRAVKNYKATGSFFHEALNVKEEIKKYIKESKDATSVLATK